MSQIKIEVTERGIDQTDRKLKKLGDTGGKTELQMNEVKNSIKLVGQKGAQSIALLDGPLGGVSSRVSSLTQLLGSGAGGLAGAMAATTAAAYATAAAMTTMVIETDNFARVAGVSIEQFNQMSFAANQFGLTADQLGDAFKDTRERIGDFIATGGGPLQDFADVMGYTKEQTLAFAQSVEGLSGRDVLVEMVRQLEEGGKSTEQMSFALEGMANDMTKLLPLLTNGASELDRLESKMASVQNPLSEDDIRQFRDFNESIDLVAASFQNMMTNAVIPLLEPFTNLTNEVARFIGYVSGAPAQRLPELTIEIERQSKVVEDLAKRQKTLNDINVKTITNGAALSDIEARKAKVAEEYEQALKKLNDQLKEKSELELKAGAGNEGSGAFIGPVKPPSKEEPKTGTSFLNSIVPAEDEMDSQVEAYREHMNELDAIFNEVKGKQSTVENELYLNRLAQAEEERERLEGIYTDLGDSISSSLSGSIGGMLDGTEKAGDAFIGLAKTVRNSLISTLVDMGIEYVKNEALSTAMATTQKANIASTTAAQTAATATTTATTTAAAGTVAAASAPAAALTSTFSFGQAAMIGGAALLGTLAIAKGARFQGGDVSGGSGYQWQERGGEAFIPKVDGRVFSKNDMRSMMNGDGGSGVTVVNNIYNQTGANVTSVPNDQGGEDIYITRDEFSSMMAAEGGNPDSDFNNSITNVWTMGGRA